MAASVSVRAELLFSARCGRPPQGSVFAPGRAVLMRRADAEAGDELLVAPTAQGISAVWGIRPDRRVAVWAMDQRAKDHFSHGETTRSGRLWADLARGAAARLDNQGWRPPGIDMVVIGDLPQKMGLASSTAYTAAILRSFYAAIEESRSANDLARDIGWVERHWGGPSVYDIDAHMLAREPNSFVHVRPGMSFDDLKSWPLTHRVRGHLTKTVRPDFDDDAEGLNRAMQALAQNDMDALFDVIKQTTSTVLGSDASLSAMREALREEPHVQAVRVHPVGQQSGLIEISLPAS